ncbi:hypothetical protein [Streptomyces sp. NPDC021212]|uniref:hypothetical protein n=1 Tax=Streptomyces sp. NPDC021212 TaxID=3365118 RepID=UPI0037B996C3
MGEHERFRDSINLLHEFAHYGRLEHTPAKEQARLYLAAVYASIENALLLPLDDSEVEQVVRSFWSGHSHLQRILEGIGSSEELLATALTFDIARRAVASGAPLQSMRDESMALELEALEMEEQGYPGEFIKYYPGISRLVHMMFGGTEEAGALRSLAFPFMQPVKYVGEVADYVVESMASLAVLLDVVDQTENTEEVITRLRTMMRDLRRDWETSLSVSVGSVQDLPLHYPFVEFVRNLWTLSRPSVFFDEESIPAGRAAAEFITQSFLTGDILGKEEAHLLVASPRNVGALWDGVEVNMLYANSGKVRRTEHASILFYEALRQQLQTGIGIVCPLNDSYVRPCCCNDSVRKCLQRLYWLVKQGFFGDADWSPPPCFRSASIV